MPKVDTIASHTEWGTVRIYDYLGRWRASASKRRPNGDNDILRFERGTKEEACAALLDCMKRIDAEDKRAARHERETAALGAALMGTKARKEYNTIANLAEDLAGEEDGYDGP